MYKRQTDNGRDLYLQADNCDVIVRNIGYGVYADGGCNVVLNDCRIDVATHAGILAGDFTAVFKGCNVTSGRYAFMCHDLSGGASSAAPLEIRDCECFAEDEVIRIKSHNIHADIADSKLKSPNYVVHAFVNDDSDGGVLPEDAIPYGNKLFVTDSELEGDIVNEDIRSMAIILKNSVVKGAIVDSYLQMEDSEWYATKDSTVALVNCASIDGIDAPTSVTIKAIASEGTSLNGSYKLPSGGNLIVE